MNLVPSVNTARLIEQTAKNLPDAPALLASTEVVTFAQLNHRADELAERLTAAGVRAETPVAVRLPRSVEQVVATLAIWKAGGVCVPVDPMLPVLRAQNLIDVVNIPIEIAADGLLTRLPGTGLPGWEVPADEGDRLAYVFFTSGSTGLPKGVAIPHLGIVNEAMWTKCAFGLSPADRGSWLSAPGFAISRWELWSALAAGSAVAIAPPTAEWDPTAVRDWLLASKVTWSIAVTTLGERLFALDWPAVTPLRLLVTGGEQLRVWPRSLPFQVVNSYGITEASSVRLAAWLTREQEHLPPIGSPIWNTRVYALDEDRRPVPQGEVGELYLGGIGLARGYVGEPQRTAERFLPDPFGGPGARMYRTGDLVRIRPGEVVEYVGRSESEVKIDGVRVDSAEVEAVLLGHPKVEFALVAVRAEAETTRLVGYVVLRGEVAAQDLRAFLAQRLPRALVPSTLVSLAEPPRLLSGKVDRASLPEPGPGNILSDGYAVARDERERQVIAAFEHVLRRSPIGIHDDFFELGGDSRGLMEVARELRFGALAALFEARTPALVARLLPENTGPAEPTMLLEEDELSPFARGLWFLEQLNPGSTAYVEAIVVHLEGPLDTVALRTAVTTVVAAHDAFRTVFPMGESGPVRTVLPLSEPSVVELTVDDDDLSTVLGHQGLLRPFDLEKGPLFRLCLLRTPARTALALAVHHLIWDGVSAGVFLSALADAYQGKSVPAAAAARIIAPAAAAETYWASQLDGAPATLWQFAEDHRPTRCALVVRDVPELRIQPGYTPFMVGLAGVASALEFGEVVIGSPMPVRDSGSPVIGYHVNTVPLRIAVDLAQTGPQLLQQVRRVCAEAWTHRALPFDDIVAIARKSGSRTPYTQVMFSYNRFPEPLSTPDGVTWRIDWLPARQPKCDLEIALNAQAEGLTLQLLFDSDLIESAVAERLADAILIGLERLSETDIERIWRETLQIDRVDPAGNFFDLGGRSMDAARLITRLNRALGAAIPLRVLFTTETFAEFRSAIEREIGKGQQ